MALLLLNLILSAFLTGLIWFVQVVHYPIFERVPATHFIAFQTTHMKTTGYVVAVPMVLELALSFALLAFPLPGHLQMLKYGAFSLVLLIWGVTFFISVPIHQQLANNGFNPDLLHTLVSTNWIRTLAWSVRTLLLGYMLWRIVHTYAPPSAG